MNNLYIIDIPIQHGGDIHVSINIVNKKTFKSCGGRNIV